jgi:hypothetical protein
MSDEDQRALAIKTVAAVFMPIATIVVMLRCYVRVWVVKGFGWDDGAMVFAAVSPSLLHLSRALKTHMDSYSLSCSLRA